MKTPSAPLWETKPTRPGSSCGWRSNNVAKLPTRSLDELAMPSVFGPSRRTPRERAASTSRSWRARPAGPTSANPEPKTAANGTPAFAQSSMAASTAAAGTATSARSTGSSMAATLGQARRP